MNQGAKKSISKTTKITNQHKRRGKPKGLNQIVIQTSQTWTSDLNLINLFIVLEEMGRFIVVAKSNKRASPVSLQDDFIRSKRIQLYDLFAQLVGIKSMCKGAIIFFFSSNQPLIQIEAGKFIEEQATLPQLQSQFQNLYGILDPQFYQFLFEQFNQPINQLVKMEESLQKQNHLVQSAFLKHLDNNLEKIEITIEYLENEFQQIKQSPGFQDQVLLNWNKILKAINE